MSSVLREQAAGVADDIVKSFPQITGVCLFGSVARGDSGPDSDLDLLVVGDDRQLTPSSIRRRLHLDDANRRVSIIYHTPETLSRYIETGSRFLVHLQLEGQVLYDASGILEDLQRQPPLKAPICAEINGQLKRLNLYEDPARYNGNFLFPLSHVYAIGKAIVMAILSDHGIFVFNRVRALEAFADLFPDSHNDIETLDRLAAFYRLASRGGHHDLPFSYHDCEAELALAIDAVRHIAQYASHA